MRSRSTGWPFGSFVSIFDFFVVELRFDGVDGLAAGADFGAGEVDALEIFVEQADGAGELFVAEVL